MFTKIELRDAIKAAEIYDRTVYDIDMFVNEWKWAIKRALVYPDQSREVRNSILQDNGINSDWDDITLEIYNRYKSWLSYCDRDSMIFNTMIRSVSAAQLSKKQVDSIQLKKDQDPPAFDTRYRAGKSQERISIRHELSEWLRKSNDPWLADVRARFRKAIRKLEKMTDLQLIKLTNGTTTIIQWDTFNVNDIVSIVFCPRDFFDKFPKIGKFFKLGNRYSRDDGFIYIEIPECDIYSNYGGEHLNIPDKDGKIREIYRMFAWIQVISKAVHIFMDDIVRGLEGNYTYNHRDWLRNIVNKEWNLDKYIIGTDMSKYSDTLDRSFIMEILQTFGMPEEVVRELDELYSQDIWDSLRMKGLHNTLATQQGQYGDFPFITLANLVLQRFVYHRVNMKCEDGYTAAVGDDTGMIFDYKPGNIFNTIQDIYGSVGVNINKTKTSELDCGVGRIDFVKKELTKDGIIDFLNTRAIRGNNIDAVIRDIFDLESCDDNIKISMLKAMFGVEAGKNLSNLSIINGGIKDDPIDEDDLLVYMERSKQISKLIGYKPDETKLLLDRLQGYLKTFDPEEEHYLEETPLISYLDKEEIEEAIEEDRDISEMIKISVLNMTKLGLRKGTLKKIKSLLGRKPSDLRSEYKKEVWDNTRNNDDAELWEDISNYESFAAFRRRGEANNHRNVSVMLPVLNGYFNDIGHYPIPDFLYYPEILISSVEEYEKNLIPYKAIRNMQIINSRLRGAGLFFFTKIVFGSRYDYVKIPLKDGTYNVYRLYHVYTESKYDILSHEIFDEYIWPYTKSLGIGYDDFITMWDNPYRISYKDVPSLERYLN